MSDTSLQVPVLETPNKWGFLVIDSKNYLNHLTEIKSTSDFCLKSVELCANVKIRNMFTSNNLYYPSTLPKEMQLMLLRNENFSEKYCYIQLGDKSF